MPSKGKRDIEPSKGSKLKKYNAIITAVTYLPLFLRIQAVFNIDYRLCWQQIMHPRLIGQSRFTPYLVPG